MTTEFVRKLNDPVKIQRILDMSTDDDIAFALGEVEFGTFTQTEGELSSWTQLIIRVIECDVRPATFFLDELKKRNADLQLYTSVDALTDYSILNDEESEDALVLIADQGWEDYLEDFIHCAKLYPRLPLPCILVDHVEWLKTRSVTRKLRLEVLENYDFRWSVGDMVYDVILGNRGCQDITLAQFAEYPKIISGSLTTIGAPISHFLDKSDGCESVGVSMYPMIKDKELYGIHFLCTLLTLEVIYVETTLHAVPFQVELVEDTYYSDRVVLFEDESVKFEMKTRYPLEMLKTFVPTEGVILCGQACQYRVKKVPTIELYCDGTHSSFSDGVRHAVKARGLKPGIHEFSIDGTHIKRRLDKDSPDHSSILQHTYMTYEELQDAVVMFEPKSGIKDVPYLSTILSVKSDKPLEAIVVDYWKRRNKVQPPRYYLDNLQYLGMSPNEYLALCGYNPSYKLAGIMPVDTREMEDILWSVGCRRESRGWRHRDIRISQYFKDLKFSSCYFDKRVNSVVAESEHEPEEPDALPVRRNQTTDFYRRLHSDIDTILDRNPGLTNGEVRIALRDKYNYVGIKKKTVNHYLNANCEFKLCKMEHRAGQWKKWYPKGFLAIYDAQRKKDKVQYALKPRVVTSVPESTPHVETAPEIVVQHVSSPVVHTTDDLRMKNFKGSLHEWAQRNRANLSYNHSGSTSLFTCLVTITFFDNSTLSSEGHAHTKILADQRASYQLLQLLQSSTTPHPSYPEVRVLKRK